MRLRLHCTAIPFALLLLSSPAEAQQAQGTTVVELLGLHTWTREMVEDSVARYQPGVTLADHACAIILRDSVGFANAAAMRFSEGRDTTWIILPVVEPGRRGQVRFRTYQARRPKVQEWADVFALLEQHRQAMQFLQFPEVLLGHADSAYGAAVPEPARELRRALRTHASQRDWELARDAILQDSSYANRTVAALVLSNFADRDSTYHLLVEGLRAVDSGASAAEMVLSALSRGAPRRVDWRPARDALEALFGGTNLFAYTDVLDALAATEIDPELGRELARVDAALLLDHLGAANPLTPPSARRYLVHVRGQDLGGDTAAWKEWVAGP
ncbi:MAG: hypothetical protein KY467_08160 [Gemmatimonadetes bacterium]|nr:hypothetical protein [Gemmatimonadota bacterium]